MVAILLAVVLSFAQAAQAEPRFVLECRAAQEILGRVYISPMLTEQERDEVIEMIEEHMPINCAVPQLM